MSSSRLVSTILAIVVVVVAIIIDYCASADGGVHSGRAAAADAAPRAETRCRRPSRPPIPDDDANRVDRISRTTSSNCSSPTGNNYEEHPSASEQLPSRQLQNRQRHKMSRLIVVQREILERLGLSRPPNITGSSSLSHPTAQDLERYEAILRQLDNSQDRTLYHQRHFYAKRFQTLLPSCTRPRNSDSSWDEVSPTEMRIHFPLEQVVVAASSSRRRRETRIVTADVKLRKRQTAKSKTTNQRRLNGGPDVRKPHSNASVADSIVRITAYQYTKPVRRGRRERTKTVQTVLVDRASGFAWVRINVTLSVEDWMKRPNGNHGLRITVESNGRLVDPYEVFERFHCSSARGVVPASPPSVLRLPFFEVDSPETNEGLGVNGSSSSSSSVDLSAVFLDVVTVDVAKDRSSRNYRDLQSRRQRSSCGLEKLFISFAELGWSDWIVQPKGFEAGFCRGACVKRTASRTSNGKFAADLSWLGLSDCCGPARAKSLSVLQYNDNGRLSISVFDDLVVTGCACLRR